MLAAPRLRALLVLIFVSAAFWPGAIVRAAAPALDVTEATLQNGLRVLVLEDHRSPVASVQI
jgi:hypothetical protein